MGNANLQRQKAGQWWPKARREELARAMEVSLILTVEVATWVPTPDSTSSPILPLVPLIHAGYT